MRKLGGLGGPAGVPHHCSKHEGWTHFKLPRHSHGEKSCSSASAAVQRQMRHSDSSSSSSAVAAAGVGGAAMLRRTIICLTSRTCVWPRLHRLGNQWEDSAH